MDQFLVVPIGFKRLTKRKQVLDTIVAHQRLHDCFLAGPDTPIPQPCPLVKVSFSGQDCIDYGQAGGPGKITDHMVSLDVHMVPRHLHMLQMDCRKLDWIIAITPYRADGTDRIVRPNRSAKKSNGVKVLKLLTVLHISLPPRRIPDVMSIHNLTSICRFSRI
jgi:hypothetical protein